MTQAQTQESPKGRSLVDIRKELSAQAASIKDRIGKPGGDFIKVQQDKSFKLPDGTVSKGPLNVVILDFVAGNFYFDRPYKEGEVVPPACFALTDGQPDQARPHPTSPAKQAEACANCPQNDFGTRGAGKACSNTRLLAVTDPSGDADAPVYLLKVSPTGLKAYDAYVEAIRGSDDSPPVGVVTDIYFDEALKYPSLRFSKSGPNEHIARHFEMMKGAKERLMVPPDVSKYEAPKPVGKKK